MPRVPISELMRRHASAAQAFNRIINNPRRYAWGMAQKEADLRALYDNGFFERGYRPVTIGGRNLLEYEDTWNDTRRYVPLPEYLDEFDADEYALNFVPPEFERLGPRHLEYIEDAIPMSGAPRREVDFANEQIEKWLYENMRPRRRRR